ncbi:hypothetical protein [Pengzhenrongella sicca]|uniref:Uncharacterized protein n=1 Tax=Pengzhenrongella sicca TaxID=2819238 RepID=A0A8A4Z8E3_9MICO|nr:hypothetical protein [Pengzhenrongella sicca]QTE28104.1 hypothetical protein J4E96_11950 [Pengzhenrongella sicca]
MSSPKAVTLARVALMWRCALIGVLAGLCVAVGIASSGVAIAWGVLGALALLAAVALVVATRPRPAAFVLLAIGSLPLAIWTWTSLVTPLIAVLCLAVGWPLGGHVSRRHVGVTSSRSTLERTL